MSSDGPRAQRARRLRPTLLLIALLGTSFVPAALAPLPVVLERPADGSEATVDAGPVALHIAFFATWCSPCVDEMRAMAALESRYAARGYRLVLVAVPTRQSRERLAAFVSGTRPPGEVLFDARGAAQKAFAVDHLPTHLVIDRSGTIVHRGTSIGDGVGEAVEALVRRRSGDADPRR